MKMKIVKIMCEKGLCLSCSEARRLVQSKVVICDGEVVLDINQEVGEESNIGIKTRIGKPIGEGINPES